MIRCSPRFLARSRYRFNHFCLLEIDQLALFADELVLRLFAEGVTRTTIRGIAALQTMIEVPSINLIAFDVTWRRSPRRLQERSM